MNLSMWIVFDELEAYNPIASITEGDMTIESFRLLSHGQPESNRILYIGAVPEPIFNVAEGILLTHREDIIIVACADLTEILNTVVEIFDKYSKWDHRLHCADKAPVRFQATLDVAHEMLQCPMYFCNVSIQIYAISQQYTKEQVFEDWDEMKRLRTMPVPMLEKIMNSYDFPKLYPEDIDPAVMPTRHGAKFTHQIRLNCYLEGKLWGHIFMYYIKQHISKGFLQLARHVANIFSQMLLATDDRKMLRNSDFSCLVDILDEKHVEDEVLEYVYWRLKWDVTDILVLFRIIPSNPGYDGSVIHWINDNIGHGPEMITFMYESSIVVILQQATHQFKLFVDQIAHAIRISDHHCGISFPFSGLDKIAEHYKQAGYAVNFAPCTELKLHAFSDCVMEGLAGEIKKSMSWREWITPSIFNLIRLDSAKNTEYYATLYHLLVNKWHLGNTAKSMFIHRNTLLYRIEKIKQLMDIDILKENVWAYLRLCYELLWEDYPVPDARSATTEI